MSVHDALGSRMGYCSAAMIEDRSTPVNETPIPTLVDRMDGKVEGAYVAMPARVYMIDRAGPCSTVACLLTRPGTKVAPFIQG